MLSFRAMAEIPVTGVSLIRDDGEVFEIEPIDQRSENNPVAAELRSAKAGQRFRIELSHPKKIINMIVTDIEE